MIIKIKFILEIQKIDIIKIIKGKPDFVLNSSKSQEIRWISFALELEVHNCYFNLIFVL